MRISSMVLEATPLIAIPEEYAFGEGPKFFSLREVFFDSGTNPQVVVCSGLLRDSETTLVFSLGKPIKGTLPAPQWLKDFHKTYNERTTND